MLTMAKEISKNENNESSSEEDDLVSRDEYKTLFKSMRFKIDVEGRVNNWNTAQFVNLLK